MVCAVAYLIVLSNNEIKKFISVMLFTYVSPSNLHTFLQGSVLVLRHKAITDIEKNK